jgi:hypothetical protein
MKSSKKYTVACRTHVDKENIASVVVLAAATAAAAYKRGSLQHRLAGRSLVLAFHVVIGCFGIQVIEFLGSHWLCFHCYLYVTCNGGDALSVLYQCKLN